MATRASTIAAFTAAREVDRATLSRLVFWADEFGDRELTRITSDEVDAASLRLAERGRLKPRRNGKTQPAGAPLSGATLNRYLSQLASVYRLRLGCACCHAGICLPPAVSKNPRNRLTPTATCGPGKSNAC